MTSPKAAILLFSFSLSLTACSFVEPIPGSESIILSQHQESCKKLGNTTVKVLDKTFGISRKKDAIEQELQILAQNSAVKMGGNAIWPVSEIKEGERSYHIFLCSAL